MRGQISVFFSLTAVLVLSALGAVTEMARIQAVNSHIEGIVDMGTDSILAEYDKDLLEQFDLFFLDGSYGRSGFSEWNVAERLESYMAYNIQDEKGLPVIRHTDLWKFTHRDTGIEQLMLATDRSGAEVRRQAVACMKAQAGVVLLEELMRRSEEGQAAEDARDIYEAAMEDNEGEWGELSEELQDTEEYHEYTAADNPLGDVKELKKLSILQLVLEDPGTVSGQQAERQGFVSERELQTGYGEAVEEDGDGGTLLFREYLLYYMGNMLIPADNRYLRYELEYILGGKESDIENLEKVVTELLLLREGMNFVYLLTDQAKQAEAYALAGAIAGAVPPLIGAVQKALLLAWAWGESIMDLRTLLSGGTVPMVKTKQSWRLGLEQLGTLAAETGEKNPSPADMDYKGYLRLLLYLGSEEKQQMRALDMIEGRIQKQKGTTRFQMDWCISGVEFYTVWDTGVVFSGLPYLNSRNRKVECRKYRCYE